MEARTRSTRGNGLVAIGVLAAGATLALDLALPSGVADGVPYVGLVLVAPWWPARRGAYFAAAAATALTVLGCFLSAPGGIAWVAIVNRGVALFFLWVTALLITQRKKVERSLPEARQQFESPVTDGTAETERHRIPETLRESEERSWAVFEDAPVVSLDAAGG